MIKSYINALFNHQPTKFFRSHCICFGTSEAAEVVNEDHPAALRAPGGAGAEVAPAAAALPWDLGSWELSIWVNYLWYYIYIRGNVLSG